MPTTTTITHYSLQEAADKLGIKLHEFKNILEAERDYEYVHPNSVFQEDRIYRYGNIIAAVREIGNQ